jgi:hypothetical protein
MFVKIAVCSDPALAIRCDSIEMATAIFGEQQYLMIRPFGPLKQV